jgi:hypothetical protein
MVGSSFLTRPSPSQADPTCDERLTWMDLGPYGWCRPCDTPVTGADDHPVATDSFTHTGRPQHGDHAQSVATASSQRDRQPLTPTRERC